MSDFGVKSKKPTQTEILEESPRIDDTAFKRIDSDPFTNFNMAQSKNQEAHSHCLNMIYEHFEVKNKPDVETTEQIEQLLKNPDQMENLLNLLRYENEMQESELEPIKSHYSLASRIKEAEEKKKEAAMDEDYENAAKYKK